jgi:hypothetical protein
LVGRVDDERARKEGEGVGEREREGMSETGGGGDE